MCRLPYLSGKPGYLFLPCNQVVRIGAGRDAYRAEKLLLLLLLAERRTASAQFFHRYFVLLVLNHYNLQMVKVVSQ